MHEIESRNKNKGPKADINLAETPEGKKAMQVAAQLGVASLADQAKK